MSLNFLKNSQSALTLKCVTIFTGVAVLSACGAQSVRFTDEYYASIPATTSEDQLEKDFLANLEELQEMAKEYNLIAYTDKNNESAYFDKLLAEADIAEVDVADEGAVEADITEIDVADEGAVEADIAEIDAADEGVVEAGIAEIDVAEDDVNEPVVVVEEEVVERVDGEDIVEAFGFFKPVIEPVEDILAIEDIETYTIRVADNIDHPYDINDKEQLAFMLNLLAIENGIEHVFINHDAKIIALALAENEALELVKENPEVFYVIAGDTLKQTIERWADSEGWQLYWNLKNDYELIFSAVVWGGFDTEKGALDQLLKSFQGAQVPLRAQFTKNGVLVIKENVHSADVMTIS